MSIDGRTIAKQQKEKPDAYESRGVGIVAHALVWVPVIAVLWFAYVSGTWMGGWMMGVLSVVSALASVGLIWLFMKVTKLRR